MSAPFEDLLRAYADLAVRVGLALRPGQRVVLRGPVEAAEFIRAAADAAYRAGARYVEVLWSDARVTRSRLEHAPADSLDIVPEHLVAGQLAAVERGDAFLAVSAEDPDIFQGVDGERLATLQRAGQKAMREVSERRVNEVNWCVVAAPSAGWAATVFPELPEGERVARLWREIFAATRADRPDPVAAWREHLRVLEARRDGLNERRFAALRFRGPGTDLRVGLADGHEWVAGLSRTPTGIDYVPNLPTEEVFTAPHRERVDGTVRASKPLAYGGRLIEGIELTFEEGRVTSFDATRNRDTLATLLDTDEGARRLGEVALVPNSSPISRSGILFNNTLFDENAASHLALGRAYRMTVRGGAELSADEAAAAGLNDSMAHVDFMVGWPQSDVDGVTADGREVPVMRAGEWVREAIEAAD